MKSVFKFTTVRPEFFSNLMVRLTPFSKLNDLYEGHFTKKQLQDACKTLDKYYGNSNIQSDAEEYDLYSALQPDINDVGVLSLTKDVLNKKMWTHYADENKGIAIELDPSVPLFQDSIFRDSLGKKIRFKNKKFGNIYETPREVTYLDKLPDFNQSSLTIPSEQGGYEWTQILNTVFFFKHEDYTYEEEKRCILPLRYADSVISLPDDHIIETISRDSKIKSKKLTDGTIQIIYPNEYEMHEDMGDCSIKDEIYMHTSTSKETIHLFRINPKAIIGLYFGAKCEKVDEIIDTIKSNAEIIHLLDNLYCIQKNDDSYNLKVEKYRIC